MFYVVIKIINSFNQMVYISEYQPTCLGQNNHLTQFSAILSHQRPRYKNLSKYTLLFFPQFFFTYSIYDFNHIFETRNHMINLSDYKPIDNCLNNCLIPFSALFNQCLTRNRNFCKNTPLFFRHFSDIFYAFIKIITTLSHVIYIYE